MSDYGPEKYHFDGASLPSLYRAVRQHQLETPDQKPVYRYPKPDKARLRCPEWVRKYMRLVRRVR